MPWEVYTSRCALLIKELNLRAPSDIFRTLSLISNEERLEIRWSPQSVLTG